LKKIDVFGEITNLSNAPFDCVAVLNFIVPAFVPGAGLLPESNNI
jgi:hypothetical protein